MIHFLFEGQELGGRRVRGMYVGGRASDPNSFESLIHVTFF